MNVNLLIDSLVQQTTVLIAQLATTAGSRTPLAHTANQVFLNLVGELKRQGLGNKVIADMFGLALRTYHEKVNRLTESNTFRGQSLSTAILGFIQERGLTLRSEVLTRFANDDQRVVRGVLKDLSDSGALFRSGKGPQCSYKCLVAEDAPREQGHHLARTANLLWVTIHRFGPLSPEQLAEHLRTQADTLTEPLEQLLEDGKIQRTEKPGDSSGPVYSAQECVIPLGDELGWEASVFDHYQAVVSAITARLNEEDEADAQPQGGSTYTYDVWEDHPHFEEVAGFLSHVRRHAVALRAKVEKHNRSHAPSHEAARRTFIAYVGQSVRLPSEEPS